MVKRILFILLSLNICSCRQIDIKGLFIPTSEGVQTRFEQSMEILDGLKAGTVDALDSYIFYVAADPHINQTHRNLDVFNDALRNDVDAAFGVILGDCTDIPDNFQRYLDALSYSHEKHTANQPIFHNLGNHDIYFDGWENFKEFIGASVYWFEVVFQEGKDLYIALDTATGTLGSKQTEWLKTFLDSYRKSYRNCVVLTHTNLFYTDNSQAGSGNMPIEETYSLIDLFGRHDVSLVLQGHDHYREELVFNDVMYTTVGAISDNSNAPEYLILSVNDDKIEHDWHLVLN